MTDASRSPHTASAGAFAFLERLERHVAVDTSPDARALRAALLAHLRAEQAADAASGLVHQLAARALDVAETGVARASAPAEVRTSLAQSCVAERSDLEGAQAAVARTAMALLGERGGWIGTVADSATVRAALLAAHAAGRAPRALVAEGRPALTGRALAAAAGGAGIPTWLMVDGALPLLLSQATLLWLGASAVTDRGAIVPVGSFAAALAAREHSVPVYVLAVRRKFLPAITTALRIDEARPDEVWDEPATGVRPRNVRNELIPLELLRGVAVEDEVLGMAEVALLARDRALPDVLAGPPAR
jgi:translation initiation factor 2B subunit (eIF-2B alpha/beta/delta family)